jgi:methionyl-tRNA formyltransferase
MNNFKIAFFGTSIFSVFCLNELKVLGLLPNLIITSPDRPKGRGLIMEANPVKTWAIENNIEFLTPAKLDSEFTLKLSTFNFQLFLVASYGKIVPKAILDMPEYGVLNIHPSLLPKYRGPSPLQEQILNDEKNVGVTVMKMDTEIDHGPIITQSKIEIPNWPVNLIQLKEITAKEGVKMLLNNLDAWVEGKIKPIEQNHSEATFTKKVEKNDGLLDLEMSKPFENYLKTKAYYPWPGTFFFIVKGEQKIRVIIKESKYSDGKFIITRVLPEGKKEMSYEDFLRGLK